MTDRYIPPKNEPRIAMNSFQTPAELINFVENILIPDLRCEGPSGTADDLEDCVTALKYYRGEL